MKAKYTIGKTEKQEVIDSINVDPCHAMRCSGINCNGCPLAEATDKFRGASEEIIRIIESFEVEEEW